MPKPLRDALPVIAICDLAERAERIAAFRPTHVVDVVSPWEHLTPPGGVAAERRLRLVLEDDDDPNGPQGPRESHVRELLDYAASLPNGARVLVASERGVSRAPAVAYLLLVQELGTDMAADALSLVVAERPSARPNRLIVWFGDTLMRADGALLAPLAAARLA